MRVRFHPHAVERMAERGASVDEVVATVREGEQFPARLGRTGFRRNFSFGAARRGKHYDNKQVEVYAAPDGEDWLVITVLVRYF